MNNVGPALSIGVLMLDTDFPRMPGDIGNPASFRYPAHYQIIPNATPATIVTDDHLATALQQSFIEAAENLSDSGASLITTSCGFLSIIQQQLASRLHVPVVTSALLLLPLLQSIYGTNGRVGILTFDAEKLSTRHIGNESSQCPITGLCKADSLYRTIAHNLIELDRLKAEREVLNAALRLKAKAPDLRAILLECTNLPPYKHALKQHTGLAVYDIIDTVHWILDSSLQSSENERF